MKMVRGDQNTPCKLFPVPCPTNNNNTEFYHNFFLQIGPPFQHINRLGFDSFRTTESSSTYGSIQLIVNFISCIVYCTDKRKLPNEVR